MAVLIKGDIQLSLHFLSKNEFISYAAHDCLSQLSEDNKEHMKENPDPLQWHFGLGMFIRNNYIHGNGSIHFEADLPDDLSGEIVDRMLVILSEQQP